MSVSEDACGRGSLAAGLALIFDLDGVIIDSMPAHTRAWERYLESFGMDSHDIEARMHGRRNDEIVRDYFGAHLDSQSVFEHGAAKERLFREMIGPGISEHLIPGIKQFLDRANGAPMAVATNAEPANVNFILDGASVRKYFRAVVDGMQVEHAKPAPDVYLRATELLGVDPKNAIVFEDSPVGIEAARAAGARVAGILSHASSLSGVDFAARNFLDPELETWLSAQRAR